MILGSGLIQSANSFTGAYDAIPSIVAAYSTRRLLTSYEGPLLRLVADRTGYPEQDIGYTAAGDLDTAAAATFLDGDDGYVATWYDQSGNARNATQATLASMPLYVASGQNGRAELDGESRSNMQIALSGVGNIDSDRTFVAVANNDSATKFSFELRPASGNGLAMAVNATGLSFYANGGTPAYLSAAGGITSHAICVLKMENTNQTRTIYKNGTSVATDTDSGIVSTAVTSISMFALLTSNSWGGRMPELVVCNAALSDSDRNAAESAANAYWSVY